MAKFEKCAASFVAAVKDLANRPEALNNFESYLSYHFAEWLAKYASTPADMACEMRCFADMYEDAKQIAE